MHRRRGAAAAAAVPHAGAAAGAGPALLLLALLSAAALPRCVSPCGHHVVSGEVRDLVALHLAHQAAHPLSGAWGAALRVGGRQQQQQQQQRVHEGHEEQEEREESEQGLQQQEVVVDVLGRLRHQHEHDHGSHGHDHGHDHHDHKHEHEHEHEEHEDEHDHDHEHEEEHDHDHDDDDDDEEEDEDEEQDAEEEEGSLAIERRRLQQTVPPPAPLRLAVSYQHLEALDAGQQQMLTRVVEAVRRILQKFISVQRPPSGAMLADPYCLSYSSTRGCLSYYPDFVSRRPAPDNLLCGLATVRPEHVVNPANCTRRASLADVLALGSGTSGPASGAGGGASGYGSGCSSYAGTPGEAADMYMYITAVQNSDCDAGAAAWARPCLLDLGNNRPLMGAANICPPALSMLDESSLTAVLAHEMIHALGFTESMFNLTRRPDGSPRPQSEVVASAVIDGRTVSRLITPRVRDAARAHFGCDSLAGAQLENEGSEGSAGSHWEYNLFQGEVMVASTIFAADGSPPALSNLTLSYLEDTGWYVANRSSAGLLAWGAGAGCALPEKSCQQYMAAVPDQRLFCDASNPPTSGDGSPAFRCSDDFKSTGVCRSLNFTGGCGLLLSRNAAQTCTSPDATYDMPDVFGWGTGSNSGRCFPVVYRFKAAAANSIYTFPGTGVDGDVDAACFDTACSADGSRVYVKMFGQSFECPAGQYLNLASLLPSRYRAGRIGPCPPAASLCATQSCPAASCTPGGGDCLNGQCYCRLAFTGPSCSVNLITGQAITNDATGTSPGSGSGTNGTSSGGSGTNGTSSGSSSPPPAAVWTQVVQLSLSLYNPVGDVTARSSALLATIAFWAELPTAAVRLALVAASGNSTSTSSGGGGSSGNSTAGPQLSAGEGNGGATTITQAGQAYDATAASSPPPAHRHSSRHLLDNSTSPSPSPSPAPSPPAPPQSMVVTHLTMPSSRATTILVGRLRDGTQVSQLFSALAAAGFATQPSSLTVATLLTKATTSPPPPPPGGSSGRPGATAAPASASEDKSNSRMVIIIAIAAGAVAAIGIIAALVTIAVVRHRRARRHQQQASQQAAMQQYLAPAAPPAVPPPSKRAARYTYQQEPAPGGPVPPAPPPPYMAHPPQPPPPAGGFSALPTSAPASAGGGAAYYPAVPAPAAWNQTPPRGSAPQPAAAAAGSPSNVPSGYAHYGARAGSPPQQPQPSPPAYGGQYASYR